jgi:hypothetical protein
MPTCPDFATAFQKNMTALGLPAPTRLFGTVQTATANATAPLDAFQSVGTGATLAAIIGATSGLEGLSVVGGLSAAFYVGAVVGSLVVTANASRVGVKSTRAMWSIHEWARRTGVSIPATIYTFLGHHPEVVVDRPGRIVYALHASRSAKVAA